MKGTYKTFFTLTLLAVIRLSVFSQSDFVPGFIQITKYDTIFGLIKETGNISNSRECVFRKTLSEPNQYYYFDDIYGYRFKDGKYYISRKFVSNGDSLTLFLEYLVDGIVDLYFYRDSEGDHYLIEKENLPLKEISRQNKLLYENGTAYLPRSLVHSNIVKYYMYDCPDLFKEIEDINIPQQKNLIQLTKKYHNITCPDKNCIIYQKSLPKFRVDIQPIVGKTYLKKDFLFHDYADYNEDIKSYFQCGIVSYFWMPNESEKLFFKTGLIYIHHKKSYYTNNFGYDMIEERGGIKIPIQFHYQIFKSKVTPVISFGFNGYITSPKYYLFVPSIGLGINAKITKNIYASFFVDSDYISPTLLPIFITDIFAYSYNFGLAVKI